MSESKKAVGRGRGVFCERNHIDKPVREHLECPYCHGDEQDVAEGDRQRFCDFDPEHDPVVFGFPPGTSREQG